MRVADYTVVNGEIISQNRAGTKRDYLPDPMGSTVALLDNTQTQTDTFAYWPFGQESNRSGSTATPFKQGGSRGYNSDSTSRKYVRKRHLDSEKGRWLTKDTVDVDHSILEPYKYAQNNPQTIIDPSGEQGTYFPITPAIPSIGHGCHPAPGRPTREDFGRIGRAGPRPWKPANPGRCGELAHRALQNAVEAACKGLERRCAGGMGCDEILRRIELNTACVVARTTLNAVCYGDPIRGDGSHEKPTREAIAALNRCIQMAINEHCFGLPW